MLAKNLEPRLIIVGGVMIAPNATVEVDDNAGGLEGLLARGVLVKIDAEKPKGKAEK